MSQADVSYSCGSCGYPLNLTSSNRITSSIASKYSKSINKGSISFLSIDPSRFTQVDEVNCLPITWGRYRSKSKFLCRNCGVLIGHGYGDSTALCGLESPTSSSSSYKKIIVKIRALQPSETAARLDSGSDRESFGLACHRWLHIQNSSRRSLQFQCSFTVLSGNLQSQPSININTFHLHRLLNRFPHLQSLSLSGCTELPDSGLSVLINNGSKLRILHLDCCFKITDQGLSFVASGCPFLTIVSLYRCNITDIGLETLSESCSALKDVNLSYCSLISDHGVGAISKNCPHLRAVNISHCRGVRGVGFKGCPQTLSYLEADSCKLEPEGIIAIVSGGGLEYLNISNLSWSILGHGLAEIDVGLISNLRVVNFRLCRTIGDDVIMMISRGCPLLQEWNLALCEEVRLAGWESIGSNCRNLERLHVNRCMNLCDRGLLAIRDGCKSLKELYLGRGNRISNVGIEMFKCLRSDVKIKYVEIMCIAPEWAFRL